MKEGDGMGKDRERKTSEAQRRAVAKYDKTHTKYYGLKLNTETDKDIISRFDEVRAENIKDGVQGYVKKLVRSDIQTRNK